MKRISRKLAGRELDLFFRNLFRAQAGLDPAQVNKLSTTCLQTIKSVNLRVRHLKAGKFIRPHSASETGQQRQPQPPYSPEQAAAHPQIAVAPKPDKPATAFDPYAFGLIPIYQRQGRDGLLEKLKTITSGDDLRRMARAQQIMLPAPLRTGDASLDEIRTAILAAVEKRIADRRAAAG
ncbi:MAG TPA: hypothetical protein VMX97_13415 [Hyphomicrobiaceae bacterium]|nr:hypothetical protein [Hyphomicrobiaceae bacterium]